MCELVAYDNHSIMIRCHNSCFGDLPNMHVECGCGRDCAWNGPRL